MGRDSSRRGQKNCRPKYSVGKATFWHKDRFGITFARYYKDPLVAVLSAYQHVDDWENVLRSESADMKQIMKCAGVYGEECNELDDTLHYRAHV